MNQTARPDPDKGTVLLAEGHPANRRLTAALLEKLGYRVVLVDNGVDALKKIEEDPQRFDLVMMNCRLPELDGPDTVKAIRWLEKQWGSRVTIVALSADQHDREVCLDAGVDGVVAGPVTMQSVRQTIADLQASRLSSGEDRGKEVPHAENRPILDTVSVANLRRLTDEGGGDFLTEVIDIFLRDSVGWMERLRSAGAGGGGVAIRKAVHTLKGSSSSLGASRLSALCAQFELQLDRGNVEDFDAWVQRVEAAYDQTRKALIAERED